jgi:hypothetical protein
MNYGMGVCFRAGERRLCAESMDCNGSKAPVRSAAGNRCKPSKADLRRQTFDGRTWPNSGMRDSLKTTLNVPAYAFDQHG